MLLVRTRVDAGVLDVFRDGRDDHVAILRNRVNVQLLGALDELGHDDGVDRRDVGCLFE